MLRLEGVTVGYGRQPVLEGVSLQAEAGSFVSLVGPSGSGKSTLLRVVAGLLRPWRGQVHLEVDAREVGFLFQDDALLPWRTARENVALGLRIRGMSARQALAEADRWLARMGLAGLERRFPHQLSGGQRKRVALTQVLCLRPRLLLMDEPFAALDAILRLGITQELVRWVEREGCTVLLVTHDLEEALSLSDRIYLLSRGPRAQLRRCYDVPFPRPREMVAVRVSATFGELLRRIWEDLQEEVGDLGAGGWGGELDGTPVGRREPAVAAGAGRRGGVDGVGGAGPAGVSARPVRPGAVSGAGDAGGAVRRR